MGSWTLLLAALGLALFLEGLPYFVSPPSVRKALQLLARMSDTLIRALGLALMVTGLWLAWVALH